MACDKASDKDKRVIKDISELWDFMRFCVAPCDYWLCEPKVNLQSDHGLCIIRIYINIDVCLASNDGKNYV